MTNNIAFDVTVVEAEEDLLIDYQFLLRELMLQKKISNTDLAAKAGMSKARLSQILSADANPTLKTFARLFHALGVKARVGAASFSELSNTNERFKLNEIPLQQVTHNWDFEITTTAPISDEDHQMVAVVRDTVASEASNDNYAPRRVQYINNLVDDELEPEAA